MRKAVELLTETRYKIDDKRQRIVLNFAQGVDRRSRETPELLAKYQKTRAYRSANAMKGVKTKKAKKKMAEQQAAGNSPVSPAGAPAPLPDPIVNS